MCKLLLFKNIMLNNFKKIPKYDDNNNGFDDDYDYVDDHERFPNYF